MRCFVGLLLLGLCFGVDAHMKRFLFTLFLCGCAISYTFAHPIDAGNCITSVVADRILTQQVEHCGAWLCKSLDFTGIKTCLCASLRGVGMAQIQVMSTATLAKSTVSGTIIFHSFMTVRRPMPIWRNITKQLSNGSTRQAVRTSVTPDRTSPPQPDTHTRTGSFDFRDPTPPQQQTEPSIDVQPEPPQQREPEVPEPEVVMPSPLALSYDHVFPEGISLHHIPIDTNYTSVGSVFDGLGNAVDHLTASRGASGWTYVTRRGQFGGALWKSIAFLAVMNEEATLEMSGHFNNWDGTGITYAQLVLRQGGITLLGIPLRSESLETVGDFFTFFRGVKSVKGIAPDLTVESAGDQVFDEWFVELDADTVIKGTAAYLVEAENAD